MTTKLHIFILILLLNFKFVSNEKTTRSTIEAKAANTRVPAKKTGISKKEVLDIYNDIEADIAKPSLEVFEKGLTGYNKLNAENRLENKALITLIDFSLPSTQKRLWVIDLNSKKVLYHTLVAHGRNSGNNMAKAFSNKAESHQSSLGFYVTDGTYFGKHGLSLYLNGVEKGFNDNARNRAVVMHGAKYVSEAFVKAQGRLGRSHGCPAIPEELKEEIISKIAKKSALFIYYPDHHYIKQSTYMNLVADNNTAAAVNAG